MSSLAIVKIGSKIYTAWELYSDFLSYASKHEELFCPFCYVRLTPVNVYKTGEFVRAPHFSIGKGLPHVGDCDGEPIFDNAERVRKQPKTHLMPSLISYPEALIERRQVHTSDISRKVEGMAQPSRTEIEKARKVAGYYGKRTPSASLLQPIVEAYNEVISVAYKKFKTQNTGSERNEWIKQVHCSMPLKLNENDFTDYRDAFRLPSYVSSKKRIYHNTGKISLVEKNVAGTVFRVSGSLWIKKHQKSIEINVKIYSKSVTEKSPRYHKDLLVNLLDWAERAVEIKWYAFGLATIISGVFELSIDCFDHLYFKPHFAALK